LISKGNIRLIKEGFEDGFDNDIKIGYGNKLKLEDSGGAYHDIYISGTSLVIPSTISENRDDNVAQYFGTGSDVGFIFDATDFHINAGTDDLVINVGNGTKSFDLNVYGNTANDLIAFDASGNLLTLDGVDFWLKDADILYFGDAKDIQMRWDATDFDILPVADDTILKFGNGTLSFDLWWYGTAATNYVKFDAGDAKVYFEDTDARFGDNDEIEFGDSGDITLIFDAADFNILGASDDLVIYIGNGTNDFDVIWYGETVANTVEFDASSDKVTFDAVDLFMGDSDYIYLGDGSDVEIAFDSTDFVIVPGTDELALKFGDGVVSWNMYWYADAAAKYVYFDVTNDQVDFEDIDLHMGDDDVLEFGGTAGGDVYMRWDVTDFDILPAADDTILKFGNGTQSFDIWIYGETAADNIIFDASAKTLSFDGVDVYMEDADNISFGDGQDVVVQFDATDFTITGVKDDLVIKVGNGTNSFDLIWYGNTASDSIAIDASGNTLTANGIDVYLLDADNLSFGDAQDIVIQFDGADFAITAAADDELMTVGDGTESIDLQWFGATADDYIYFDVSGNTFDLGQDDHGIDLRLYGASTGKMIKWDQTNDELDVTATIEMQTISKLQFRDTAIYIQSDADASLSLVSDGAIKLSGRVWFHDANTETLSGNRTLLITDYMLQFIDPDGARTITLPAEASSAGLVFIIANAAGGAEDITVQDDAPATVVTIGQNESAMVFCDGVTWFGMVGANT